MNEKANIDSQEIEAPDSHFRRVKKSVRVSVGLSPESAEELDAYMKENGISTRPAAIESLMRDQIRRIQAEKAWLERHQEVGSVSNSERVVKTEGGKWTYIHTPYDQLSDEQFEEQLAIEARKQKRAFDPEAERLIFVQEDEGSGQKVFSISLIETASKNNPVKQVRIRKYWKTEGEILFPIDMLTVPRSWVKWLIDALKRAENAAQTEVSENRRRAHEKRASRDVAEIACEKELLALYIERYSKEQVARAKVLSGRHRIRAVRRALIEHFTPWEWLDLCATQDFGCACCGLKVNLEPHHKVELSQGGANTIDNIEPLCRECHKLVNPYTPRQERYIQDYRVEQQRLLKKFKPGDEVRRSRNLQIGTIKQLLPLKPNGELRWPTIRKDSNGNVRRYSTWWRENLSSAQAIVVWPSKKKGVSQEVAADLQELSKVESVDT